MIQNQLQRKPGLGMKPLQQSGQMPQNKPNMPMRPPGNLPQSRPAGSLVQPISKVPQQGARPMIPGQSNKPKAPVNPRADLSFDQFDDDDDISVIPEKTTITPRPLSASSSGMIKKPLVAPPVQRHRASPPRAMNTERDTQGTPPKFQVPAPKQPTHMMEKKEMEFSFNDESEYGEYNSNNAPFNRTSSAHLATLRGMTDSVYPDVPVETESQLKLSMDQSESRTTARSHGSPLSMNQNEYEPMLEESLKRSRDERYNDLELDGGSVRAKRLHMTEETEIHLLPPESDVSYDHEPEPATYLPENEIDQQQHDFDMDEPPRDTEMESLQSSTYDQVDEPHMDIADPRPPLRDIDLNHIEQIAQSLFAAPLKTTQDFLGVFDTVFAVLQSVEKERLNRLADDLEITKNEMQEARASVENAFGELTKMMQLADDETNEIQQITQEKHNRMAGLVQGLSPITDMADMKGAR